MIALYYGVGALIIATIISLYFLDKTKKIKINADKMVKILSLVLAGVYFVRYMWNDIPLQDILGLETVFSDSKFFNATALCIDWLFTASILLVVLYPFFKEIKGLDVLVKYFALPVGIISYALMFVYGVSIAGKEAFVGFNFRLLLLSIEYGIIVANAFVIFMQNGKFKTPKKELKMLFFLPIAIIASMPCYAVQGFLGLKNSSIEVSGFTFPHRFMLYGAFVIPVVLYFLFYKKELAFRKFAMLFISLGTMMSFLYAYRFPDFADVSGLPIHLCHTAMFIVPLCLIFKWDKLFYFTYFINVLGAFLAMAMPNFSSATNWYGTNCVRFFINHYIAFFMPLLIVALKIYARPKLKEFKYSMVGFGVYFVFILICNAWFSNYAEVDYFFVNSDFIARKLGSWAEDLRISTLHFTIHDLSFTFYPIYQLIFFIVYVILGLGMWFLYEAGYSFADTIADISARKQKIKLDQIALDTQLEGRGRDEPMSIENQNKLVLKNFSKRYGTSSVYAVKDANLEISGGEIFGFLGHNGAGKSTIIKSIVGIQPITSGEIQVCGFDVDKQPVMAKKQIGYVPDHYALYEKLTGREYINYIADLYDVSKEERDQRISKYVKLFELEGAFDNQIKTYSHGMKQKIAIMSALVHNPRVWILDEPLTGLDPASIFQVKECMREHAKNGNIVFFSSHLIDIVEQLCDKVAIIKKGNILVVKDVKEIENETTLEQFYLKTTEIEVKPVKVEEEKKSTSEKKKSKRVKKQKNKENQTSENNKQEGNTAQEGKKE